MSSLGGEAAAGRCLRSARMYSERGALGGI